LIAGPDRLIIASPNLLARLLEVHRMAIPSLQHQILPLLPPLLQRLLASTRRFKPKRLHSQLMSLRFDL